MARARVARRERVAPEGDLSLLIPELIRGLWVVQPKSLAKNHPTRPTLRTLGLSATPWISHCLPQTSQRQRPIRDVSGSQR